MGINEVICDYIATKTEQAATEKRGRELKKHADMLADIIIRHAGGLPSFDTDVYTVGIKEEVRIILDTEKLYHDFKDIKEPGQYGKESVRTVITAIEKQQEQKTA